MAQVKQVDGKHYETGLGCCPNCGSSLQHWDYASGRPYLEMSVSKYLDRHKEKGGFQGVLKALSFVLKLMLYHYPEEYKQWQEDQDRQAYNRYILAHDVMRG